MPYIKEDRRIYKLGRGKALSLPPRIENVDVVPIAMNHLMLVDLTGEIKSDELLELLKEIEPKVWKLVTKIRKHTIEKRKP